MTLIIRLLKIICRIFLYIGCAAILILLAMTVVDVVRRFIFGVTMTGVTEWSQILLIISMTTIAQSLIEGRLIAVDVFVNRFPRKLNIAFEIIMGVISVVFFAVVGFQFINQIGSSIRFREAYFMIRVPRWPFYGVLGASFFASALATIVYVYERVTNFKSPKDKNIFDAPDLAFLALAEDGGRKEGGAGQ